MSNNEKREVLMVKLPDTVLEFINGNPTIAKIIGTIVVKRQEILEVVKEADVILADHKNFTELLEQGSEADLENFLYELREALNTGDSKLFSNITTEQAQQLIESSVLHTEV